MDKEHNITIKDFAELLRREQPRLLRYACYRLGNADDAKDALQDTCLKLCDRIANAERGEVGNLLSYVFRTLSNVCTSRLAVQGHVKTIPLNACLEMADIQTEDNEEELRRVVELLGKIPEEQADVIRLRIYGNNSFAEVAEILSVPLPTVKSRFLYGMEKIRKAMNPTNH